MAFVILHVALFIWALFWFAFCSSCKSIVPDRGSVLRRHAVNVSRSPSEQNTGLGREQLPCQALLNPVESRTALCVQLIFLQADPSGQGQNVAK